MSFLLTISRDGADYRRIRENPSRPVVFNGEKKKLLVGYVFQGKECEALDCGWEENPKALQQFDGSMVLISWKDNKVILCSDLMGCEKVYYYPCEYGLLISDEFWDIVREIQPKRSDLDEKNVRARLLLGSAFLNESTVIKGLSGLLPATRVEYDIDFGTVKTEAYQLYRFSGEITDIEQAVGLLDQAMDAAMRDIKQRHGNVVYGVGLSGGLDSRLVLHYALKNGMRVSCFNICQKRPNGVLTARSVRLARKLAKLYGVPLTLVEWDPKKIDKAKKAVTQKSPDGPLQEAARDIYKYVPDWEPDFDVLLNGGASIGTVPFATHYSEKEKADTEQAVEYMEEGLLYIQGKSRFTKGLHWLFGLPVKKASFRYPWEQKLFFDPREDIHRRLLAIAGDMMKSNASFFETVFNFKSKYINGSYAFNDVFNSLFRTKPVYCVYSSNVLKVELRCSPKLLGERRLIREMIQINLPEASRIAEEGHEPAPAKMGSFAFLRKCLAAADQVLRGDGSHVSLKNWRKPVVWRSFEEDMNSGGKWFREILDVDVPLNEAKKIPEIRVTELWDTKRLLDTLEKKSYLQWE